MMNDVKFKGHSLWLIILIYREFSGALLTDLLKYMPSNQDMTYLEYQLKEGKLFG